MRTQNRKIRGRTERRGRRRIKPRAKESASSIGSSTAATRSQAHRLISLHTSISHSLFSAYRRRNRSPRSKKKINDKIIVESGMEFLDREKTILIFFSSKERKRERRFRVDPFSLLLKSTRDVVFCDEKP